MKYLVLLLLIVAPGIQAEQCQTDTDQACKILVEGIFPSGKTFQLEISEAPLKLDNSIGENRTGYWGANGKYPASYIDKISLMVEESKLSIPSKIYADLGNLTFAEVKENEHAIILIVKGGEASAAYYATFVFADYKIRKRTVRSNKNPDLSWEKTSFHEPGF